MIQTRNMTAATMLSDMATTEKPVEAIVAPDISIARATSRPPAPSHPGYRLLERIGQRQHLDTAASGSGGLAGRARLVAQQALHACLAVTPLPAPHRRPAESGALRHLGHRQALSRQQNDPRPLDMLIRTVAVADDRGQSRAILSRGNTQTVWAMAPDSHAATDLRIL
jgi:hypothetical protein